MTNCIFTDRWIGPFALLSDEEFEGLLEHSNTCAYHARVLDEYNESGKALLKVIITEEVLPVGSGEITRAKVLARMFSLKWQDLREGLAGFIRWPGFGFAALFAVIAILVSLSVIPGNIGTNLDMRLGVMAGTFVAAILFSQVLRNLWRTNVMNDETEVLFAPNGTENFSPYKNTYVGKVPARLQPSGIKTDEKTISSTLKEILRDGFNPETCQMCLDLLTDHEAVVRRSWVHTLNRARFLRGTGKIEEAEGVVQGVLTKYSNTPEALGTAYEVLSWFEELEYNEGGEVDKQSLVRRMNLITEGLKHYPTYYQLLINAFEVEQVIGSYASALEYLNRLAEVDSEIAKQYFIDNYETEVIKESNWELKRTIESISSGMKINMAGAQALTLILIMVIGLAGGILLSYAKANPPEQFGRRDGTSVGLTKMEKGGTSVGAT